MCVSLLVCVYQCLSVSMVVSSCLCVSVLVCIHGCQQLSLVVCVYQCLSVCMLVSSCHWCPSLWLSVCISCGVSEGMIAVCTSGCYWCCIRLSAWGGGRVDTLVRHVADGECSSFPLLHGLDFLTEPGSVLGASSGDNFRVSAVGMLVFQVLYQAVCVRTLLSALLLTGSVALSLCSCNR